MKRKKLYKCLALSLVVSMAVSSAVYASPSKEGEGSEKAVLMSVSGKAAAVLADSAEGAWFRRSCPGGRMADDCGWKSLVFRRRPVLFFGKRKRILVRGSNCSAAGGRNMGNPGRQRI